MATAFANSWFTAFVVLLMIVGLIATTEGRFLKLGSSDDDQYLVSDGVVYDHDQNQLLSAENTCNHQYGFLPCPAENVFGYIYQIVVYQGILIFGEMQRDKGTMVLTHILGVGKLGGVVFRILVVLPSLMLMIVSGVFSSKENAQAQVSVGVGIYAGITVFSLTLQWGICVILGRKDLPGAVGSNDRRAAEPSRSKTCLPAKEKLILLKESGVEIDEETRQTAGVMLLTLVPYIIVQLADIFRTWSGTRIVILAAFFMSALSLAAYLTYQIWNPLIQQRSLDYAKHELLRREFLQHVKRQGQVVNDDGTLNTSTITKLFCETDKNDDKSITKDELQGLVEKIIGDGRTMQVDKKTAVSEFMATFDLTNDGHITEQEFIKGCKKYIDETNLQTAESGNSTSKDIFHEVCDLFKKKKEDDPREVDRMMSKILKYSQTKFLQSNSLVTQDGKPNIERIQTLFNEFDSDKNKSISVTELENLITTVGLGEFQPNYQDIVKELFNDFDKDKSNAIEEPEFVEAVQKFLNKVVRVANARDHTRSVDIYDQMLWKRKSYDKWDFLKSVFQVLLGIAILTFLGGPLMVNILELSMSMGLPSFCISFVMVPLAMNANAAFTAFWKAGEKTQRTASLTFSEIYGGVIMNNLAGLTTLLAIVYAKDLTWDFSAEVLMILVVCAVVGILAYSSGATYRLWTCILAFFLYPFSLALFYFLQVSLRWN